MLRVVSTNNHKRYSAEGNSQHNVNALVETARALLSNCKHRLYGSSYCMLHEAEARACTPDIRARSLL